MLFFIHYIYWIAFKILRRWFNVYLGNIRENIITEFPKLLCKDPVSRQSNYYWWRCGDTGHRWTVQLWNCNEEIHADICFSTTSKLRFKFIWLIQMIVYDLDDSNIYFIDISFFIFDGLRFECKNPEYGQW